MITPDIRKILRQSQNETMKIVLSFEVTKSETSLKMITPLGDRFEPVRLLPSFKYANYSDKMEQFALAICLELYTVSDAIKYHKEFYKKHLKPVARPNFTFENVNKSFFHRELFVPIKPPVL